MISRARAQRGFHLFSFDTSLFLRASGFFLASASALVTFSTQAMAVSSTLVATMSISALNAEAGFAAQGFICSQSVGPSGEASTRCRGHIQDYSRPINVYIPSSFRSDSAFTLAFHFHGFWTARKYDPFTKTNGDYGSYLAASGKNALLFIPESLGADTTYAKELAASSSQLNRFFTNVDNLLNSVGVSSGATTPRVVSGHSGAYVLLAKIGDWAESGAVPALRSVQGFALFDCAYGYRAGLVSILKSMRAQGSSAYFSAYNPLNSDGKRLANLRLQKELGPALSSRGKPDVTFVQNRKIAHMEFMRAYMTTFYNLAL